MDYYSALKSKEVLAHIIIWIKLEDIMLSKISQSQKHTTTVWFHLYEVTTGAKFTEAKNRMVIVKDCREGKWEVVVSVLQDEKMLDAGMWVHNSIEKGKWKC